MFGSIFSIIKSLVPGVKSNIKNLRAREVDRRIRNIIAHNFKKSLIKEFANTVLAQEIPDDAFSLLINAGEKDIVSYFFEADPSRGDYLSANKIKTILLSHNLSFFSDTSYNFVDEFEYRALKLLSGFARLDPDGAAQLIVSPRCALVTLALKPEFALENEVLIQTISGALQSNVCDIKAYCQRPDDFVHSDGLSLRYTDLLLIHTIRDNPNRVFDILFLNAVA